MIKFRLTRYCFTIIVNRGPVMWRCTNGEPNHRKSWWLRFDWRCEKRDFGVYLTPALQYLFWHGGVLNSRNPLGSVTHSCSLWSDWIFLHFGIMLGRTQNLKVWTDEQIRNNDLK